MSKLEIRLTTEPVEIRSTEAGGKVAVGYAITYNKISKNLGGFVERVAPGAVDKTLQESDIRALYNHDPNALLGRKGAGTLRLGNDERGVPYEIDLPDTTVGRDTAVLLERQDIVGASFGFRNIPGTDTWGRTEQGFALRTLNEIHVAEISLVPNPAYPDSSSALRSLAEVTGRDFEEVRSLAESNDLLSLIEARSDDGESEEEENDSQAKPTVAHRSIHIRRSH